MNYSQMKVLITGGLGLIGSNLAHRLVELGARVTLLDGLLPGHGGNLWNIRAIKPALTLHLGDMRDQATLETCIPGQDLVFNLAGQGGHLDSMLDPLTDLELNVRAHLELLESCRRLNPAVRLVFSSTRQVHGIPRYLPLNESHPIQPIDINGIHKATGEYYHRLYHSAYGMPVTILRLTNTYGAGMRIVDARQSFLGYWVRLLLEGKPLPIFGDGRQVRDFNHVDDCVEALLRAGSNPLAIGKIYLLGGCEVVSLLDLASSMARLVPGGGYALVPFPVENKKIDIGSCCNDFGNIKSDLDWEPCITLANGLRRTVDYYAEHFAHYVSV
ncbi:MAG: NAD-dependent epimerase/dehydratase family protein [Magnetococcales bacterium]|nr:NAD-dependent epimerase/dehydratase family protein [Magnetococcales bacterium]